ncbi:conserved exported hypothetical protein [Pseudomonas sp. OF001]|uniref:DUF2950 domain-containing protein n=1 Tax=Pseudomonas sp. OF001 TaxID=2772300 RepID=UPI001918B5A5|nr:DUF2950 domain-containing protein [Pseudomonas sp. OF001]CAD5378971.1 conserved exported hypothetical protein [Pseudomonas sp. OF001]
MHPLLRICLPALLALLTWEARAQQAFATPTAAVDALIAALGTEHADPQRMAALLGDDWQTFIPTDDIERKDVDAFLALYREQRTIRLADEARASLVVGNTPWTFPLPLVHGRDGWRFDPRAGGEEIRARRIGRNELAAMQAVRAYHDAQMDYAEADHDGDGVLEYAQQFMSSDGRYDGLYWPDEPGVPQSPLGPLFGDELPDGEWQGYRYRILDAQGPSAPGGAYAYKIGADMSRGFALIAWPARYGDSGVMSFMISHDGLVFEKDMGPDGAKLALAMPRFDPDSSWHEVKEAELAQP